MATQSNRGKTAEDLLKKAFAEMSTRTDTAFYRLPDARSGSWQATLADFLVGQQGRAFLVECKEVEHDYRLPHGNFGVDQVARLRMFQSTRAYSSVVLIYHSRLELWRAYNVERFVVREGGSWDLRDTEPKPLKQILLTFESQVSNET